MEKIIKSNKKLCNLLLNFIPNIYYFYGDSISIRLVFTSRNSNIILEKKKPRKKKKPNRIHITHFIINIFLVTPNPYEFGLERGILKPILKSFVEVCIL